MPHVLAASSSATRRLRPPSALADAFDTLAFLSCTLGLVHVAFLAIFGFNVITEALAAGPVAMSAIEAGMAVSTCYVVALAFGRRL